MDFSQYGFPYPRNLIVSFIGGSEAHGAKVGTTDDTDWYGLFIEPPEKALGLDGYPHFVTSTGGKEGGNGPDDVDVCLYSLRKWAGLAAKGNPSCLHFLFAPPKFIHPIWRRFTADPSVFLSRHHVKPFLGFADDQMKRLLGEKGQKNIHRADLEKQHGYDTKYAMHVIRLYGEAKELMEDGRITLPRPNKDELIAIRRGKYKLSEIKELGTQLQAEALRSSENSQLPAQIDRQRISQMVAEAYQEFWATQEQASF